VSCRLTPDRAHVYVPHVACSTVIVTCTLNVVGMGTDTTQTTALVEGAVQGWYAEISDYTFDTGACVAGKMCGHYTQVVWADTTTLGCGATLCGADTAAGLDLGGNDVTILVCNYAPPGNVGSQQPYIPGETCAACSSGCSGNLCTTEAASCTDLDPTLTYNEVAYNTCADLVEADAGVCSSWAEVGSTYCRRTCESCEVPAGE
jgi:hypothetical protein